MKLPPYAELLGASVEQSPEAGPVLVMPFGDDVVGRPGFLHGGAIAGLLEMAGIAALRHALREQTAGTHGEDGGDGALPRITPINVTIDFMRGGRDKPTRAAGTITRLGARIANVEATAWQDDPSRPIAGARLNYLIDRE